MFLILLLFLITVQQSDSAVIYQEEILEQVNAIRKRGCKCDQTFMKPVGPLKWNPTLEQSAYLHAKDMHENDYFSHYAPDGKDIGDRADAAGYLWRFIGENIAFGQQNIQDLLEDWLNSYEHCSLIMNPNFDEMGVSRYGHVWVQHLGSRKK